MSKVKRMGRKRKMVHFGKMGCCCEEFGGFIV